MPPNTRTTEMESVQASLAAIMDKLQRMEEKQEKQEEATLQITERLLRLEARSRPPSPDRRQRDYSVEEPEDALRPPANQNADTRFRAEEIGHFDGEPTTVKAFTERLVTVATVKGAKVIQSNLVVLLTGEAHKWYNDELPTNQKWAYNSAPTIDSWCEALKARFAPGSSELTAKLKSMEYGKANIGQSAVEFVQDVLSLTNQLGYSKADGIRYAYDAFQPSLRLDLPKPPLSSSSASAITAFMQGVRDVHLIWKEAYPVRPPEQQQQRYEYSANQRPYNNRPPFKPSWSQPIRPSSYQTTQQRTNDRQQGPSSYPHRPRAALPAPPSHYPPQASFFTDVDGQEWEYDAPSHAYIVSSAMETPGHTPKAYGNTHDGNVEKGGQWEQAGPEHRCAECPHYH